MDAPARPTRGALARLAHALDRRLAGRYVERVWHLADGALLLKHSGPGGERLLLGPRRGLARVTLTPTWPPTPAAPDRLALSFRKALEGARIRGVEAWEDRGLTVTLTRGGEPLTLSVQLAGRFPNVAVLSASEADALRLDAHRPARDPEARPFPEGADPWPDLPDEAWLATWDADVRRLADEADLRARHQALTRHVRAHGKRLERKREALEHELARSESADRHRHFGELLKASLRRVPAGAEAVRLPDWALPEGGETEVPLDPRLTPVENMQRHFHLYRKLLGGRDRVEHLLLEVLEQGAALVALAADLKAFSARDASADAERGFALLAGFERRLRDLGWRPGLPPAARPRADASPALPYRTFRARDGTPILVGRSARDNDRLTFQVARGHDLWLHARDAAGSHVILRRAGRTEPSPEALLDAALLAAWHSKLRGEAVVDVMWTERKHVRKTRGAAPGLVTTACARTLTVREDPARLRRLYETLEDAEGRGDGAGYQRTS